MRKKSDRTWVGWSVLVFAAFASPAGAAWDSYQGDVAHSGYVPGTAAITIAGIGGLMIRRRTRASVARVFNPCVVN